MVSIAAFRKIALSLAGTEEALHFENPAFLVKGKIFATLNESPGRATLKLVPEQQEVLTSAEPAVFQPVPNFWGQKGWTWMLLKTADLKTAESALTTAHANVSAKPRRSTVKRRPAAGSKRR
jgi:predicted DNA-binding protein (MmcQ/YjbR family)